MITISAFKWVPEFAQGQVRDLRARWALEEAGLPYRTRLLAQGDQDKPDYRALQPFGQVPILEEDGLVQRLHGSGTFVAKPVSKVEQRLSQLTSFTEDIGADSLDIVELVMELEEEFEITIPDDQAEKIKNLVGKLPEALQ